MESKQKMIGLEYMRVLMMLMIFCFHAAMHANVNFGVLSYFVEASAVAMEGFFMLSGFVLEYKYGKTKICSGGDISLCEFYKKRILAIYPLYFFILIVRKIISGGLFTLEGLAVFPFELLGLSSSFDGTFGGGYGDWFVSCMFFCYFCYPLLMKIIHEIDNKKAFLVIYLICAVAPVTASVCGFSWVYPNPFYRMLQFALGMMLAKDMKERARGFQPYIGVAIGTFLVLAVVISFLQYKEWGSYASYEIISIPCWAVMLCTLSQVESKCGLATKVITFFASISYAFYLSQTYCYILGTKICQGITMPNVYRNIVIGCVCFLICLISAAILTNIDVNIKRLMKRKRR